VLHIAWVMVPPTTYGLVPDGLCYAAGVLSEAQKARELQYWHDALQVCVCGGGGVASGRGLAAGGDWQGLAAGRAAAGLA
jgi:hypothetical protein